MYIIYIYIIYIYIYIYIIYIYIDIDVDIDREIDRCCCKYIVSECTLILSKEESSEGLTYKMIVFLMILSHVYVQFVMEGFNETTVIAGMFYLDSYCYFQ